MLSLEGIQAVTTQTFRTPIEQGTIVFTLYYKPAIQQWYIDVEFGTFLVRSLRVCHVPNILEQWSRIIPFGLNLELVDAERGYEPILIDDFSSGRVRLNVLDQDELEQIENVYSELKEL